jgi:hypothetical protein
MIQLSYTCTERTSRCLGWPVRFLFWAKFGVFADWLYQSVVCFRLCGRLKANSLCRSNSLVEISLLVASWTTRNQFNCLITPSRPPEFQLSNQGQRSCTVL